MLGITDIGACTAIMTTLVLLPVQISLYFLTVVGKYGEKVAYCTVAGIFLVDSILMMLLFSLGISSVIKNIPILFFLLQTAGSLYLSYLGYQLLRSVMMQWRKQLQETVGPIGAYQKQGTKNNTQSKSKFFYHAVLLSVLNPKSILFFSIFFVQFVDPNYVYLEQSFLLLAVILQLFSLTYLGVRIYSSLMLVRWFHHYQRLAVSMVVSIRLMLIGFSPKLCTTNIK